MSPRFDNRSTAPNGAAVERICEQSYGSFESRPITGCSRENRLAAARWREALAAPLAGRFRGLFGQKLFEEL
jgi:hypothetical protein